jgi:RNA polymerase sigma factor (sigma-70 family)
MARKTDPTRFEQLVRAHHAAVYRSALRVLRSGAEAEDAAQEVFLRVLDGRLQVADGDEAEAQRVLCWWAIRVAWNTRRGDTRRAVREERHAMQCEDTTDTTPTGEGTADETTDDVARERNVWGLVDQLPDELRVPLLLRFAEGLPFARIGEALGVAESTAHERVGRALGRLRQRLAHVGLGAFVPGLEERLVASAAETGATAPPTGLAARLVALEGTRVVASAGLGGVLVGGLVCAALAVTGAALWSFVGGPTQSDGTAALGRSAAPTEQPSELGVALVADAGTDTRRALAAATVPAVRDAQASGAALTEALTGVVMGRVIDADGAPLERALVTVHSVERAGKSAAYVAKTTTDTTGAFSTAVEVANAEGGNYLVQVTRLGYTISSSEPTRVRAGATVDVGAITATPHAGEVVGAFTLELAVVDVHGAPVAGAVIELASVVDLPVEPGTQWTEWYARSGHLERIDERAVTDVGGLARLASANAGAKLVRVKPRGHELAPLVERFDAAPGAAARLVLVAEPGRTISGTLCSVDGGVPANLARRVSVHVRDALSDEWRHGEVSADGRFVVEGLPSGTHRVQLGPPFGLSSPHEDESEDSALSPTWFDVEIEADAEGSSGHDIALKRAADPRDVGHHAAELHGRLVRSEDGAPLVVGPWALETDEAPDLDPVAYRRDWLPNHLFPAPAQRMVSGPVPADSDQFHLTGLEAGRYVVRCNLQGRASFVHGPLELGEREVRAGLVLVVEAAGSAAGRVLDPDGRPLDGAFVLVTGRGPLSDAVIARGDRENRNADGRGYLHINGTEERSKHGVFTLAALPSGLEYRLVALHHEYAPAYGPTFTLTPGQARTGLEVRFTERAEPPR